MTRDHATNMTQSELEKWRLETGDDAMTEYQEDMAGRTRAERAADINAGCDHNDIEAMRQACADDCASLERQLEDKEAELAFEEKAHGQTLAERDAARAEIVHYAKVYTDMSQELQAAKSEVERLKVIEQLYNAATKAWNPVYETVLNERDTLRAEVERLKTARDGFYDDTVELRTQLIDLRQRNVALEGALLNVRDCYEPTCAYTPCKIIARAALATTDVND